MITTARLILRSWQSSDRDAFAEMSRDPRVMEHMPKVLSREESDAMVDRIESRMAANGFGLWAISIKNGADFAGFAGITRVPFESHFTPAVEIGWRLAFPYWGKGYATEGALASLDYGFRVIGLSDIIAMTVMANRRSWQIMERIGMKRDPKDDFDHPSLPKDSPLSRHILYRMARP